MQLLVLQLFPKERNESILEPPIVQLVVVATLSTLKSLTNASFQSRGYVALLIFLTDFAIRVCLGLSVL